MPDPVRIRRLIGVYNANGTWRGELAYFVGARVGRAHCALCDITHGTLRERDDWKTCRAALPVPFDTFHRNDQPDAVRAVVGDRAPVVVAETDRGFVTVLEPADLDGCHGSPELLVAGLEAAARDHNLEWPPGPG
jgi:hypothetical protein